MEVLKTSRAVCWTCHRAQPLCLCQRIKPFRWDPLLAVLIHPKEFRKTIGTARLVKLAVQGSMLWTGYGPDFDQHPQLLTLIQNPEYFPVVLFPGPKSTNLSQASPEELGRLVPPRRRLAVLVIDGSWSLAQKMLHTSQVLRELPRVSFDVVSPSHYRFRKQPKPYCLSTVEAIHILIEKLHERGLSPAPIHQGHHTLLDTSHWLVQEQIKFNEFNG